MNDDWFRRAQEILMVYRQKQAQAIPGRGLRLDLPLSVSPAPVTMPRCPVCGQGGTEDPRVCERGLRAMIADLHDTGVL